MIRNALLSLLILACVLSGQNKTTRVRSYVRKDGRLVRSYTRRQPTPHPAGASPRKSTRKSN